MKKIQIKITTFNEKSLTIYGVFIKRLLNKLGTNFSFIKLPKKTKKLTLLKSPHVHKKAREQFEQNIYKNLITIKTECELGFLKLLAINKPKNIKLKIKTKI
jgi:small subunit ribosomal protein S10